MNTVQKGNKLEDKIFEQFKDDISKDLFWAKKDLCKIYKKKGYYSDKRKKNIIFDISIEIFLPGQKKYSLLVLIECKNYTHKVPVDDVEEFFAKINQISEANTKAIIVSNNSFQEGAHNFSESTGIGLLRYYDRDKLDWVLTRSPSSFLSYEQASKESTSAYLALHDENYQSEYYDFYGFINHKYTNSLCVFISNIICINNSNKFNNKLSYIENKKFNATNVVKFIKPNEIEEISSSILSKSGYKQGKIQLENICKIISNKTGLKIIETTSLKAGVLGQIKFDPLEIHIDSNHKSIERKRFTIAHELGHYFLGHSAYMHSENCYESSIDLESSREIEIVDIMRMEWQANQFASSLLLPKTEFIKSFIFLLDKYEVKNRGFGVIYLDEQQCNKNIFYKISTSLMLRFNVSRTVVKIRLKKLGLINEP